MVNQLGNQFEKYYAQISIKKRQIFYIVNFLDQLEHETSRIEI